MGGLGNQMFQYAAARSLAIHKKTNLCIDVSGFSENTTDITKRIFELGIFNIQSSIASQEQMESKMSYYLISKIVNKLLPYYRKRFYYEPHFHYDNNFFKASSSAILVGYWQSEKYFGKIAAVIRNEFMLQKKPGLQTQEVFKKLSAVDSVSVHIRRGDYINNLETLRMHGSCEVDYYKTCIHLMKEKVPAMQLFVFSDDIPWVRENLKFPCNTVFVDHNTEENANEDLYLMTHCKHNIIANSSFSWWGAWMNNNENKIVMAPSKWFNEFNANTKDLYPPDWIIV
ncbi:MAG: alpha-1,2-fucosyltransferase [Chryseobacterium sp.]